MTSENLLVTIVSNLLAKSVDGSTQLLFTAQSQYCWVRTEVVSPIEVETKTVGRGRWCFDAKGTSLSGITVDGTTYNHSIDFGVATDQQLQDFMDWLNSLLIGTFFFNRTGEREGESFCFFVLCAWENGLEYDPVWVLTSNLVTQKAECNLTRDVKNCCKLSGEFYVVKVNEVEYLIPSEEATLGYECLEGNTFDNMYNNLRLLDQFTDYTGKVMHPCPTKITEDFNKVLM